MNSVNIKRLVAVGWIFLVLSIAVLVPVASVRGWLLTTIFAFGPAVAPGPVGAACPEPPAPL